MKRKINKNVSLGEYIRQTLLSAQYERDTSLGKLPCIVGEVPQLPGCYTQAETFEEARENLVEAIELWVTMELRQDEKLPVINGCMLVLPELKNVRHLRRAVA